MTINDPMDDFISDDDAHSLVLERIMNLGLAHLFHNELKHFELEMLSRLHSFNL